MRLLQSFVPSFVVFLQIKRCTVRFCKVAVGKGISKTKSKQQSPCSKCMHQPAMSWGNACSMCMHRPVMCMHQPVMSQADACTYCMGSKVCLGYTFTPSTLEVLSKISTAKQCYTYRCCHIDFIFLLTLSCNKFQIIGH